MRFSILLARPKTSRIAIALAAYSSYGNSLSANSAGNKKTHLCLALLRGLRKDVGALGARDSPTLGGSTLDKFRVGHTGLKIVLLGEHTAITIADECLAAGMSVPLRRVRYNICTYAGTGAAQCCGVADIVNDPVSRNVQRRARWVVRRFGHRAGVRTN